MTVFVCASVCSCYMKPRKQNVDLDFNIVEQLIPLMLLGLSVDGNQPGGYYCLPLPLGATRVAHATMLLPAFSASGYGQLISDCCYFFDFFPSCCLLGTFS